MNTGLKVILGATGLYFGYICINAVTQKADALELALELSGNKGIVNLGAGCERDGWAATVCQLPQVWVNVDMEGTGPNMYYADLEIARLPFQDKQFGVAFASHVLEHLDNWQGALDEWTRIADHTVVIVPSPFSLSCVAEEHKQVFGFENRQYIEQHWPSVKMFM